LAVGLVVGRDGLAAGFTLSLSLSLSLGSPQRWLVWFSWFFPPFGWLMMFYMEIIAQV
jgi:hypothetical protein